jgi:hypothetical protein
MVSKIQTYPSTDLQTIHVTYLNQHGSGKADVACPKKIKSRTMGGAVQFNGDSLECLAIGEGIETCLSYYQENYRISVWSALSSSNFKSIILPPPSITKEVIILSDNDHQGLEAAQFLALRLVQEKRVIRIVAPQQDKSDFNDLLTNFNNPSIRTV